MSVHQFAQLDELLDAVGEKGGLRCIDHQEEYHRTHTQEDYRKVAQKHHLRFDET